MRLNALELGSAQTLLPDRFQDTAPDICLGVDSLLKVAETGNCWEDLPVVFRLPQLQRSSAHPNFSSHLRNLAAQRKLLHRG
jgi:hypothetical protein